ncbi:hypothetical protein ACFRFL_28640 [Streptomyces sp. NPDC056708]|uniref:hypothetical protein n=1 Tax=unclassified Streptomyces TaxID=2593676 RepID=UPI0036AD1FC4
MPPAPQGTSPLRAEWPALYEEATRAERFTYSAPLPTACFCARRAIELAAHWMYDRDSSLRAPYKTDLNAMLHEPRSRSSAGPS